jgi:hypothetical protein
VKYKHYLHCTVECIDLDFFEEMENADPLMAANFNSTVR